MLLYHSTVKTKGCHSLPLEKNGSVCHILSGFCENDFVKMTTTQMKQVTAGCIVQHTSSQISLNVKINSFDCRGGHRFVFEIQ